MTQDARYFHFFYQNIVFLRSRFVRFVSNTLSRLNLKPLMTKIVKENSSKTIEEMWQFSPQIEISQMYHEEMDSKMFIT